MKIDGIEVTKEEMAFGITANNAKSILRNWITFLVRECIWEQEPIAYKNELGTENIKEIKTRFNTKLREQILTSYRHHQQNGTIGFFKITYCANGTFLEYDENIKHYTLPKLS